MEREAVNDILDSMGLPWDDPMRGEVENFAARPIKEQLLWIYVDNKRSNVRRADFPKHVLTGAVSFGMSAAYIAMATMYDTPLPFFHAE